MPTMPVPSRTTLDSLPDELLVMVASFLVELRNHKGLLGLMLTSRSCYNAVAFEAYHFQDTIFSLQKLIAREKKHKNRLPRIKSIAIAERVDQFQVDRLRSALNDLPGLRHVQLRLMPSAVWALPLQLVPSEEIELPEIAPRADLDITLKLHFDSAIGYAEPLHNVCCLPNLTSLTVYEVSKTIYCDMAHLSYLASLTLLLQHPPPRLQRLILHCRTIPSFNPSLIDDELYLFGSPYSLTSFTFSLSDSAEENQHYRSLPTIFGDQIDHILPLNFDYLEILHLQAAMDEEACTLLAEVPFGSLHTLTLYLSEQSSAEHIAEIRKATKLRKLTLRHLKRCPLYSLILTSLPNLLELHLITDMDYELHPDIICSSTDVRMIAEACPNLLSVSLPISRDYKDTVKELGTLVYLQKVWIHMLAGDVDTTCHHCALAEFDHSVMARLHRALHGTTLDRDLAMRIFRQIFNRPRCEMRIEISCHDPPESIAALLYIVGRPMLLEGSNQSIQERRLLPGGIRKEMSKACWISKATQDLIKHVWPELQDIWTQPDWLNLITSAPEP